MRRLREIRTQRKQHGQLIVVAKTRREPLDILYRMGRPLRNVGGRVQNERVVTMLVAAHCDELHAKLRVCLHKSGHAPRALGSERVERNFFAQKLRVRFRHAYPARPTGVEATDELTDAKVAIFTPARVISNIIGFGLTCVGCSIVTRNFPLMSDATRL